MRTFVILICSLFWASFAYCQETHIYVSDAGNFNLPPWQILKYDEDGTNPEVFITENLDWPQDIVFLEGYSESPAIPARRHFRGSLHQ